MDNINKETDANKSKDSDEIKATKKGRKLNLILVALLIAAIAAGGFFYAKYRDVSSDPKKAVASKNASETKDVIDALNKILLTESDKQPTVARVDQPETLKKSNTEFYKNVNVGDYLVLYPQRAIIFRRSENKLINVAPIVDTSKPTPASATTPAATGTSTKKP